MHKNILRKLEFTNRIVLRLYLERNWGLNIKQMNRQYLEYKIFSRLCDTKIVMNTKKYIYRVKNVFVRKIKR